MSALQDVQQGSADRDTLASMFDDFARRIGGGKNAKRK